MEVSAHSIILYGHSIMECTYSTLVSVPVSSGSVITQEVSRREERYYNQLQKYLRHCTVFWHKWPVHDLVLVIPLHPLSKLLAIQDHTQNLEEQL